MGMLTSSSLRYKFYPATEKKSPAPKYRITYYCFRVQKDDTLLTGAKDMDPVAAPLLENVVAETA